MKPFKLGMGIFIVNKPKGNKAKKATLKVTFGKVLYIKKGKKHLLPLKLLPQQAAYISLA